MEHLIAKTKGGNGEYFKIISNTKILKDLIDLDNSLEYDPGYILDDEEWFTVDKLSEKDYCIDLLTKVFISTDYNQIPIEEYNNIEFLCSYQSGTYYFQKIFSGQLIKKNYITISKSPVLIKNEPIIVINNFVDAIYKKKEDILYFKKLPTIASIFKGIDTLYKEATKEETESFLKNDFISLENNYDVSKVKKANRKRIALALDTLKTFSHTDRQSIYVYVKNYCDDLNFDEEKSHFIISTETDLKKLLYGIEQRYYTTMLGAERRLANSVTRI